MLEFPPTVNSRTCGISYHDTALMSPLIPEQLSMSCHQPWYSASGVSGAAPDGSGSVIVTHEEMTTRRDANLRINFGVSVFSAQSHSPRPRLRPTFGPDCLTADRSEVPLIENTAGTRTRLDRAGAGLTGKRF